MEKKIVFITGAADGIGRAAAIAVAAKQNIRVSAVLPGNIETPMMNQFTGGDIQKAIDLEPVGRLGKPEVDRGSGAVDEFGFPALLPRYTFNGHEC